MTPPPPRRPETGARLGRGREQRLRVATSLAVVIAVVLVAGGCVGSGKTPRTESIEPLPDGIAIETDVVDGCREGESGFDYRFLVVGPADTRPTGAFGAHLRDKDFIRTVLIDDDDPRTTDDLAWAQVGYQHREHPLRVQLGGLERYLADPQPFTGPPVESIPEHVRADAERYLIVALRPSDFQCHTPL